MLPRYADFLRRTGGRVDAGPLEEATVRQADGDLRQLLRVTQCKVRLLFIADVLVHHLLRIEETGSSPVSDGGTKRRAVA